MMKKLLQNHIILQQLFIYLCSILVFVNIDSKKTSTKQIMLMTIDKSPLSLNILGKCKDKEKPQKHLTSEVLYTYSFQILSLV